MGHFLEYGQPDIVENPPIENVKIALKTLIESGGKRFIIGDLPDVGATPLYAGTEKGKIASEASRNFNSQLDILMKEMEEKYHVSIVKIDSVKLFADIFTKPDEFGYKYLFDSYLPFDFIDFTNPLENNEKEIPNEKKGLNPDEFLSFWGLAAGSKFHKILADRVFKELNDKLAW